MSMYADRAASQPRPNDSLTLEQLDQLREKLIIKLRNEAPETLGDIKGYSVRVGAAIRELIDKNLPHLSHQEARTVQTDLMDDIYGWGPLSPLMKDPDVTDIKMRWYLTTYEKLGEKCVWDKVLTEQHVRRLAERMAASVGRKVDEGHPIENCRLPDGSRVSIILNSLSLGGSVITIRRFGRFFTLEDLAEREMFPANLIPYFKEMVLSRKNILISGGFGSGKSTFGNALFGEAPHEECLVIIEDPAESNLLHTVLYGPAELRNRLPNDIVHLEPRHSNIEGVGEVTIDRLYKEALSMKPTRILISQIIDWKTAYYSLMSMILDQPGSITTNHSKSLQDALLEADTLLQGYPGGSMADPAVRANMIAGIDVVFFIQQIKGHRRIMGIANVCQTRRGEFPEAVPVYLDQGDGLRRVAS